MSNKMWIMMQVEVMGDIFFFTCKNFFIY